MYVGVTLARTMHLVSPRTTSVGAAVTRPTTMTPPRTDLGKSQHLRVDTHAIVRMASSVTSVRQDLVNVMMDVSMSFGASRCGATLLRVGSMYVRGATTQASSARPCAVDATRVLMLHAHHIHDVFWEA